jgi:hypothetical protein
MHSSELHHIEALLDPSKTEIDAVQPIRDRCVLMPKMGKPLLHLAQIFLQPVNAQAHVRKVIEN